MPAVNPDPALAAAWWQALQPYKGGARNPRADRAALARLRRADLFGAMEDPATFALFRDLGRSHAADLPAVALCAATLASVREDDATQHAARALGAPPGQSDAPAVMSPLRFRRLIEAPTDEERLVQFRRAVTLAHGRINVRDLAAACLDWSDWRRRRWIFDYYGAGAAAPVPEPATEKASA